MSEHSSLARAPATEPEAHPVLEPLGRVSRLHGAVDVAARLSALRDWLADDLADLERDLADVGAGGRDLAWRAARHLLAAPGKRVRPLCVMLAARMGGRPFDQAVRAVAVACELVHSATLLHDDVIDLGDARRGTPTARVVYGNAASVLGGDHLLVDALQRVRATGAAPLLASLLDVIGAMVAGEALQLARRGRFEPDRAAYLEVVRGKTAVLFRWALEAGATLGGLPASSVAGLAEVGDALGMAFQLVDDVIDLEGDAGKTTCADLREGKLTWPLVLAAERAPTLAARMRAFAAADGDVAPVEARALVDAVRATGALADARAEAARYGARARRRLATLPEGPSRAALEAVVDAALARRT